MIGGACLCGCLRLEGERSQALMRTEVSCRMRRHVGKFWELVGVCGYKLIPGGRNPVGVVLGAGPVVIKTDVTLTLP